jgi:hypothetical protein
MSDFCLLLCIVMWQGKDAADFKGTSMFKRVHGMLQAVFRARGVACKGQQQ